MTTITATVEPNDVDVALEQIFRGIRIQLCCPVQRALQAQVDRVAVVFQASWHLGEQDKTPATKGEPLPGAAVAFIASFDAWVKAIQAYLRYKPGEDLAIAKAANTASRPAGLTFSVELPSKPMVEPKAEPA